MEDVIQLQEGDIVTYNIANSPKMKITFVNETKSAKCVWFDRNQAFHSEIFEYDQLIKVDDSIFRTDVFKD